MDKVAQPQIATSSSLAEAVHATMRFVRVLRHRKSYVFASFALFGVLGALYFATATRVYEANASVLVVPHGSDVWSTSAAVDGSRQALIPTYERLFYEDVVLDGAVSYLQQEPESQIDFAEREPGQWTTVLRKNLSAKRVRRTNLIEISYRSRDPRAAEAIVTAIARSYLDFMQKNHRNVSTEIVGILDKERVEIEKRLEAKHLQLRAVRRQFGDLGLGEGADAVHPAVQRVLAVNESLIQVQQKAWDLQASLVAVRNAIAQGGDLRQHLVAFEPIVGRELLLNVLGLNPQQAELSGQLEQKLIEDRARLDKLQKHYGPAHPKVVEVTRTIHDSQQYLANYQRHIADRLQSMRNDQLGPTLVAMLQEKLAQVTAHQDELAKQYLTLEQEAIRLNDQMTGALMLENEVRRLGNLHDTLLNRIAGIDINQDQADVRVTMVSNPAAGNAPVSPRLPLVAMFCLVAGITVGATVVYVLDLLDDRFQSPDEIEQQLASSLLTLVPKLPESEASGLQSLCTFSQPDGVEAEAFRTLRTALRFATCETECFAMTSAEPGDGKTTLLANLGVTFAQAGRRTLLIDADMRRPGLSKLFDLRGPEGLSHLLSHDLPVTAMAPETVCTTNQANLDILPCGPKATDPSELLSGPRMAELLAWAGSIYDQVLVDCPPVGAASDAAIVGRQVDGVVLVVQPEKNHRRLVLRSADTVRAMQAELIGVVANGVAQDRNSYYYGMVYGHEYNDDELDSQPRRAA
jgi:succinoglycan biosynthesis transport protein ExoP